MTTSILLLPQPQKLTLTGGPVTLSDNRLIALATPRPAKLVFTAQRLQGVLSASAGLNWQIVGGGAVPAEQIGLHIALDETVPRAEGYRLTLAVQGLSIRARDEAGVFYAVTTLSQLIRQFGSTLPALVIEDWPDMPNRGVMLDISRDKVPTMETLYHLVDTLASWKINQFQLYTEHTFAYRQHMEVWAKASPMTAEDILALDVYCRERFIDLVPNQNSFGHMHRWFDHAQYMPLAETEGGFVTPWGEWYDYPFSLTPTNPDALPFLEGLFDELLPNFTSQYFNVGCDETFDLGQGRSKALCEAQGKGRVYLDFLLEIYRRVSTRGKTMQFWGDIIGNYPELVPELPRDVIAMEWGYEADHPFDEKCAAFAASGIPFYVCPGSSSWTTIAGRTDNAMGNIRSAVENGLKHGAIGVLNTDWGDLGHWQPFPVSYLGFAYGAALGWAYQANVDMDLPDALDRYAFDDQAGVMGQLAYDLGNVYQKPGVLIHNGSILFWAYHMPLELLSRTEPDARQRGHRALIESDRDFPDNLRATLAYLDDLVARLDRAQMSRPDAATISEEFRLAADMLRHGAKRLLVIQGDNSHDLSDLRAELDLIEARYRTRWLTRNRPGGLDDSAKRIADAGAAYR